MSIGIIFSLQARTVTAHDSGGPYHSMVAATEFCVVVHVRILVFCSTQLEPAALTEARGMHMRGVVWQLTPGCMVV